jgi:hypothetical protein
MEEQERVTVLCIRPVCAPVRARHYSTVHTGLYSVTRVDAGLILPYGCFQSAPYYCPALPCRKHRQKAPGRPVGGMDPMQLFLRWRVTHAGSRTPVSRDPREKGFGYYAAANIITGPA